MKITIKLAVAALAATCLFAPSSALAGKSHLLKLYKVEQHVDLDGQEYTYNVECKNDDLALDGMWRVDDVAQDNDYINEGPGGSWSTALSDPPDHAAWDVLRSVRPVKVAANGPSSYDFEFTPLAGGDVSMKLWITCLGEKAQPIGAHTHTWKIDDPNGTMPAAGQSAVVAGTPFTTPGIHASNTGTCKSGSIVVQPSFTVASTGDANLVSSYPSANATKWTWRFEQATGTFGATVSWKCLALKGSTDNSHAHRVVRSMAKTSSPSSGELKKAAVSEVQRNCGEHYKGMLGGWDYYGKHTWLHFLGMDPRIKTRAYKFVNSSTTLVAADHTPDLYLVCFKDKTT